jgi:hypothetical protein
MDDGQSTEVRRGALTRRQASSLLALGAASATFGGSLESRAASWEKIDEEHGIEVFRKDVAGTPLHAFRGRGLIDAPMDRLMWVMGDNSHRTEWVDRLKKSVILEQEDAYSSIVYQHFGTPALVAERDFVYRARARSLPDGSGLLEINSVQHPKAPPTIGVRGELKDSSYLFVPQGKDKTLVEVVVLTDPKGSLPKWAVNLVQKSWPMNTLLALRKQVKKPFVRTMAPPPVR